MANTPLMKSMLAFSSQPGAARPHTVATPRTDREFRSLFIRTSVEAANRCGALSSPEV
jgi:hypothetical protein